MCIYIYIYMNINKYIYPKLSLGSVDEILVSDTQGLVP